MRKILLPLFVLLLCLNESKAQKIRDDASQAEYKKMQPKLGLKVGYNYARLIGIPGFFRPGDNKGFMIGGFYSPTTSGRGFRTELVFSRQGFSYTDDGKMQDVRQDYIFLPQLYTFTLKEIVQVQVGGQVGYLLNAQQSASNQGGDTTASIAKYMNRFDYGAVGGFEVYPCKGLLVGGRYNVSLGNLYKRMESSVTNPGTNLPLPLPFNPREVKGKNSVV